MEDSEQLSANQVMGRCHVDMSSLKGRETFRKWLELVDEDSKAAGWVEIALRWAHDPQRVLQLPEEFTEPETEENLSKEANELLVCLLRGKNLPVMDKNLLGGGGARRRGNRISGALRHRRDVVSVAASARWHGVSRPSTRRLDGVEARMT